MILLVRIRYAEADGNDIKKGRACKCSTVLPQIVAGEKAQLVDARPHISVVQKCTVCSAVMVRHDGLEERGLRQERVKFDFQAACGLSRRGIQYVRCQSSHRTTSVHYLDSVAPLRKIAALPVAPRVKMPETAAMSELAMTAQKPSAEGILTLAHAALAQYAMPEDIDVEMHSLSENATLRVTAPDGRRWALRLHRDGYQSKDAIESELQWLMDLRETGVVATPIPVNGANGDLVQAVPQGGTPPRYAVLSKWEQGIEPQMGAHLSESFERLGEITAHMHLHAQQWQRPAGFTRHVWNVDACLGKQNPRWGRWRDGFGVDAPAARLFAQTVSVIRRRLEAYGKGPERFGLIHADLRLANLLIDGDVIKVIDFDDCGFGWWMYDAATPVSFHEHEPDVPELIAAWKDGYRRVSPLSKRDEVEIPTFIIMRRLLLVAWVGSHRDADIAASLGSRFTDQTLPLCEAFLGNRLLAAR